MCIYIYINIYRGREIHICGKEGRCLENSGPTPFGSKNRETKEISTTMLNVGVLI